MGRRGVHCAPRAGSEIEAIVANLGPKPLGFAQYQIDQGGQRNRLALMLNEGGQTYLFVRR
jgi:hypothetical protein